MCVPTQTSSILHLLTAVVDRNWQHRKFGVREGMNQDIECTYDVTLRAFVQPLLQWKTSNTSYIFWICVCTLWYTLRKMSVCHVVICGLPRSTECFPNYLINGRIFRKMSLNTKCVFWFSLQLLSETFLTTRRTERDMIKNVYCLHVKYRLFLSDFYESWIFSTDCRKMLKYQIS